MKRALAVAALMHLLQLPAYADGRINFRVDFNRTNIDGAYNDVGLKWQGIEFEFEQEFATSKVVISGFSFGLRRELFYAFTGFGGEKDVRRWDEGTYLTLRMYRNFDLSSDRSWSIGPSVAIFWGIPGTTLDRTIEQRDGVGGYDYTHVFPMRNSDVPTLIAQKGELVGDSALFYPELSVALRKKLAKGGITLDWIGGLRIIRFGIVDSNALGDIFGERRVFIPTIGLRVGFRIF